MKKNLFGWLVMAAMLVGTGCSTDEVVNDYSPENAIQFGTYVGRDAQSRGTVTQLGNLQASLDGFGVFAYYTGTNDYTAGATPNFMFNQQVTGYWETVNAVANFKEWRYSPAKYWPNNVGDKVSFFAYAPYDAKYNTVTGTTSKINFLVDNTITQQKDLLWNNKKNVNLSKGTITEKVTFNFAHALSRIHFTVQAAVDEVNVGTNKLDASTTITVNKVILKGDNSMNIADPAGAFYTAGDLDLNNYIGQEGVNSIPASWSNTQGFQAFVLEPTTHFVNNTAFVLNSTNSSDKNPLTNTDSYLMIIPQDFTTTPFYVYIDYTVTTTDNSVSSNSSTINNRIIKEAKINFESGKAYSINLCLGMTSVKLDATVSEWGTDIDNVVNVPINTITTTPTNP